MKTRRVALVATGVCLAAAAFACAANRGLGPSSTKPTLKPTTVSDAALEVAPIDSVALSAYGFVEGVRATFVFEGGDGGDTIARKVLPSFVEDGCVRLVLVVDGRASVRVLVADVLRASSVTVPGEAASFGPLCGRARDKLEIEVSGRRSGAGTVVLYVPEKPSTEGSLAPRPPRP